MIHKNFCSLNKAACFLAAAILLQTGISNADPLDHWNVSDSGTTNNLNAVLYTNHLFVAVGDAGTVLISSDGNSWSAQISGTTNSLAGIAYGNGKYVAVGANDTTVISDDAVNWTAHSNATGTNANWNSICFGQGKFAMAGVRGISHQNFIYSSTDGSNWTQTYWSSTFNPDFPSYTLSGIVFGNDHFAIMGNGQSGGSFSVPVGEVLTSTDATNWYGYSNGGLYTGPTTTVISSGVSGLAFANGRFVIQNHEGLSGNVEHLLTSDNGTNWTEVTHFPTQSGVSYAICGGVDNHLNEVVVDAQAGSSFLTGLNVGTAADVWESHSVPSISPTSITYGKNSDDIGVFVTVGGSNILNSVMYPGGIVWTNLAGGNWSDPNNWLPHEVPGQLTNFNSGDDVFITNSGNYTVVLDLGPSPEWWDIHTLTLGAGAGNGIQTLAITNKIFYVAPLTVRAGGNLKVNGAGFHANITVEDGGQLNSVNGTYFVNPLLVDNGGTLNASGDTFHQSVVVADGGTFTTTGTTMSSDSSLINDGALQISSGVIYLYGAMTNSGDVNIYSNGGIYIYNDGTPNDQGRLLNSLNGTLYLNGSNGLQGPFSQSEFDNEGTVVNSASGQISVTKFDTRDGIVTNLSSTLHLRGFQNVLAGTFYATNGTTIAFSGGASTNFLVAGDPLVLAGGGQFQFESGYLDFPTDIIPGLDLRGGVLKLEPAFQDGAITNLALDGINLTNSDSLPVTGIFAVTNSSLYESFTVENGALLTTSGATFHGALTLGANSLFSTVGATIASDGWLENDGTINIPSGVLYLYGAMTNSGDVDIYSNGGIYIYNDGRANNQGYLLNSSIGTIHLNGFNGLQGTFSQSEFVNEGAVITSSGAQISVTKFNTSNGVVTNLSGTLRLSGFQDLLAGAFYATNNATITFSGGTSADYLTAGSPFVLDGGGQFQFASGYLDLPDDIIPGLDLRGGVLKLEPAFQGGAITNLVLDGILFTNDIPLPVIGNFSTTNSALAGTFLVNNGGVWNAYGNNIYGSVMIADGAALNDQGTVQIKPPGSMNIAQNGQVNLTSGYLYLYAPLTNSGTININGNNYIYIYDNGTSDLGGVLNQSGGVINLFGSGGIGTTSEGHEYLINNGSIIKSGYNGNTSINVSKFTNSGAITAQTGTLQLNKITLQSSSSLNSRFNSQSDYGKFSISGAAVLDGTFNATLNSSYVPALGATFNVLSYGSSSGNFASLGLPAIVTWFPQYNSGTFSLVVGQPQFTMNLSGNNLIFEANGGAPGSQGILLTSTNVALPLAQWIPASTNTFDFNGHLDFTNNADFADPVRFFILKFP